MAAGTLRWGSPKRGAINHPPQLSDYETVDCNQIGCDDDSDKNSEEYYHRVIRLAMFQ